MSLVQANNTVSQWSVTTTSLPSNPPLLFVTEYRERLKERHIANDEIERRVRMHGFRILRNKRLLRQPFVRETFVPKCERLLKDEDKTVFPTKIEQRPDTAASINETKGPADDVPPREPDKEEQPIEWSCLGPYSFERKGEQYTVARYFKEVVQKPLRYPHLPMIHTGRDGYFPIEFLFYGFGRATGLDADEQCQRTLAFNDEFSAKDRMDNLARCWDLAKQQVPPPSKNNMNMLDAFGVTVGDKMRQNIPLLEHPRVGFKVNDLPTNNGSWNLRNVKFFQ